MYTPTHGAHISGSPSQDRALLATLGSGAYLTFLSFSRHDRLTQSKCKRIVRIESIAEQIIALVQQRYRVQTEPVDLEEFAIEVVIKFSNAIAEAIDDENVVGFKSVICYRTGLAVPDLTTDLEKRFATRLRTVIQDSAVEGFKRLEDQSLDPWFLHTAARVITSKHCKKPLQFHTGLVSINSTFFCVFLYFLHLHRSFSSRHLSASLSGMTKIERKQSPEYDRLKPNEHGDYSVDPVSGRFPPCAALFGWCQG